MTDITHAVSDLIDAWHARFGLEPVTISQVAELPGAEVLMGTDQTRQALALSLYNFCRHPTLRPVRVRGRYAYRTKAGLVRVPALWALEAVEKGAVQ